MDRTLFQKWWDNSPEMHKVIIETSLLGYGRDYASSQEYAWEVWQRALSFPKSALKEAGRAILDAYEDPANTHDLLFALGSAAIKSLKSGKGE